MPYDLIKLATNKFMVVNSDTGRVHSKSTTKTKAVKQIKLLNFIDAHKKK